MAIEAAPATGAGAFRLTRPLELTCFALCVANVTWVAASFVSGTWLIGPDGLPLATDFVNVWAGGRHALEGAPATAYDVNLHKAAQVAALGHPFDGAYPWLYPPTFFFVAMALATLPFVAAQLVWVSVTFAAYVAAIHGIIRDRASILLACAFPGIVSNFVVGQNGFLTAALIGGMLVFLERRPFVAGVLLGLLSFKPHLGVLIPLVLMAGGYWRVIAAAAVTTVLLAVAAWAAFGSGPWEAFLHALPTASQETLSAGLTDWFRLQSILGLVRTFGGGATLAWTMQLLVAGAVAILLCMLWRSRVRFDLKAAGLATGVLLVTPYVFLYDLVVLAVAMAFLLRDIQAAGARPGDMPGLAGAAALILSFPLVTAPVGFMAAVVVAVLVARRAMMSGLAEAAPAGAAAPTR
jgi:arabinofuranan 3-O-arabinosyltransferase